jgi:hypothetical protein
MGDPVSYAWHPPSTVGRRAALRSQGHRGPSGLTGADSHQANKTIVHGVCHVCGRRTFLFLPARMCERDVKAFNEMVLAALEEMEDA